jgi:DNA-binding MarR family transcriptional regulator
MNQQEILSKFLGSETEARLLRFLFHHPGQWFRVGEIARRIKGNYNTTNAYIGVLEEIGLVQSKISQAKTEIEELSKLEGSGTVYALSLNFPLYSELRELVLKSFPVEKDRLTGDLKKMGRVRLALLSGVFLNQEGIQLDLFVVADDIEKKDFDSFIEKLEAEVGRSIRYTLMDTSEFTYRYNLYDRFVRNIFKKPHIKLLDDLQIK